MFVSKLSPRRPLKHKNEYKFIKQHTETSKGLLLGNITKLGKIVHCAWQEMNVIQTAVKTRCTVKN